MVLQVKVKDNKDLIIERLVLALRNTPCACCLAWDKKSDPDSLGENRRMTRKCHRCLALEFYEDSLTNNPN
jgi:hypothetical protein